MNKSSHELVNRHGDLYVKSNDAWSEDGFVMLIEGDCDTLTATSPKAKIIGALYDLYQTDDTFSDGDVFVLDGEPIAVCEGVHVVPA